MILALSLLPALAFQAADQGVYALGRDQAGFARELFKAGYTELAANYCKRVEAIPGIDPKELSTIKSVDLDLRLELARSIEDPIQRKNELTDILKAKDAFIAAYPDSAESKEAQANLPDIYRMLGEAYTTALQKTEDTQALTGLRKEGDVIFLRGEQSLTDRIDALNTALRNPAVTEEQGNAITQELMTTIYNLARTYYFHSLLLGPEDVLRDSYLKKCIAEFQQFGLDYGDNTLNFSGMIFSGLANHALGKDDDALRDFDDAIALRNFFDPTPGGQYPVPSDFADIISAAVLQKMLLLTSLERREEAVAACDDFLKTIPDAAKAEQGLAVISARLNIEIDAGDTAAAQKTAQMLVDADPRGPYGARGREVQGKLLTGGSGATAGVGQREKLLIAQSLMGSKDFEQAIKLCNQVIANVHQSGKPSADTADAYILAGVCFENLGAFEEASVAYDAAVASNPDGPKAPDALLFGINTYRRLYKNQKKPFYDRKAEVCTRDLATRFPNHPQAAKLQLLEAKKLEDNDQLVEAAALYQKVAPESPAYQDAQYAAGVCLYQEAARLAKAKKFEEAKAAAKTAETQFRQAQKILDDASAKTLDLDQKANYDRLAYLARTTLGELLMLDGIGRQQDVVALTQELETKYAGDEAKIGEARSLRVRALTAVGKVDEARNFLESLVTKDPNSKSTAAAAGVLARTLDKQASDLFQKDPKAPEVGDLWKQAFRYYGLSVQPKLNDAAAARSGDIEQVANRIYVMSWYYNDIPESVKSFVNWRDKKLKAPEYWEKAATLYEASLAAAPTYVARVNLARAYSFLGKYREAADNYLKIIQDESFIDPLTNDINRTALNSKSELMNIYLELGLAQLLVGRKDNDTGLINDAGTVFDRIVKTAAKTSEVWWQAKYYQLSSWIDVGDYKKANLAVRDLERNTDHFDGGKYGLAPLFEKMKADLEKKVPGQGTAIEPAAPKK